VLEWDNGKILGLLFELYNLTNNREQYPVEFINNPAKKDRLEEMIERFNILSDDDMSGEYKKRMSYIYKSKLNMSLIEASTEGDLKMVKYLLSNHASVFYIEGDDQDEGFGINTKKSALSEAIKQDKTDVFFTILDLFEKAVSGYTASNISNDIKSNMLQSIKLVQEEIQRTVESKELEERFTLQYPEMVNRIEKIKDFLIKLNPSLIEASTNGDLARVNYLLSKGASAFYIEGDDEDDAFGSNPKKSALSEAIKQDNTVVFFTILELFENEFSDETVSNISSDIKSNMLQSIKLVQEEIQRTVESKELKERFSQQYKDMVNRIEKIKEKLEAIN